MNEELEIRPCPICKEPVNITDWPVAEASGCEQCGAAIYITFKDELVAVPWGQVEF